MFRQIANTADPAIKLVLAAKSVIAASAIQLVQMAKLFAQSMV
jgi:hypothetical protein